MKTKVKTTKSHPLRKFIFIYGAVFTITLTIAGLTKGLNKNNLIATLLFLPVSLYFIFQIIKKITHRLIHLSQSVNLKNFIAQNDLTFFITLGLFILIVLLVIFQSKYNQPS